MITNSKFEIRNPKQTRSSKFDLACALPTGEVGCARSRIRISSFGFPSSLPTAFTLIELLLAIGITAIVLIAMNAAFFSALRLRESTNTLVDESLPRQQALNALRRDLQGTVPSDGILAGAFKVGDVTSLGLSLPVKIEFSTTTGALLANEPWGEVQKVTYGLKTPSDRSQLGKDLIRSVTRNLLATLTPQPQEQWLMSGIESLEFSCYDGSQWRTEWDTTVTDTNLPSAVRVRVQLAGNRSVLADSPIEIVVPIESQSRTNLTASGG